MPKSIVLFVEEDVAVRVVLSDREPVDAAERLAAYLRVSEDDDIRVRRGETGELVVEAVQLQDDDSDGTHTVYRVFPYTDRCIREALEALAPEQDDTTSFMADVGL